MEVLARSYMQTESSAQVAYGTFAERLEQWTAAFEDLKLRSRNILNPAQHRAVALLEVEKRYFLSSMNQSTGALGTKWADRPYHDPMRWDKQIALYDEIVEYSRMAVAPIHAADGSEGTASPVFTFDYGCIPALFSVVARCRDPHIRRKAINVLQQAPRQEGVWKSSLVARVATSLMTLEEAGLDVVHTASDIPASCRIDAVSVSMDPVSKRAIIHYNSQTRNHQDYLEWLSLIHI